MKSNNLTKPITPKSIADSFTKSLITDVNIHKYKKIFDISKGIIIFDT